MEYVFYCGDCKKFFYAESNAETFRLECVHCHNHTTINCKITKSAYMAFSEEEKDIFKRLQREKFKTNEDIVSRWRQYRLELESENASRAASFKLTTGYDFQGYTITEYYDVLFDEILVGLGLGRSILANIDNNISALTGSEATAMINKLNEVKRLLRTRIINKAAMLGANALIGIDFESSKLGDLIMVSMTATAVKIEKSK